MHLNGKRVEVSPKNIFLTGAGKLKWSLLRQLLIGAEIRKYQNMAPEVHSVIKGEHIFFSKCPNTELATMIN